VDKPNARLTVRMAKWYSTDSRNPIVMKLEIEDAKSGLRILEIPLTAEQVCDAIIGNSEATSEGWFTECSHLIGSTHEHKSEEVTTDPREPSHSRKKDGETPTAVWTRWAEKQVSEFEVDGWGARLRDLQNFHNRVRGTALTYNVHFSRFVDSKGRPLRV